MHRSLASALFALLAGTASLAGCSSDIGRFDPSVESRLRIINAAPDVSQGEFLLEGVTVTRNVRYPFTAGYLFVQAGTRRVGLRGPDSTVVLEVGEDFAAGATYTFIATGRTGSLEGVFIVDDETNPPAGSFKIRMVNVAPSAGPVDLYVTGPDDLLDTATPTLANVAFKDAPAHVTLTAATLRIRVTTAGTKTVLVDSGSLPITSGQISSLFLFDHPGGGGPFTSLFLADGERS